MSVYFYKHIRHVISLLHAIQKKLFIHFNLQERAKEEEREPSLFKVYFATYWVRMLAGAILKFITDMGAYVGPLAIGGITLYVTDAVYGEHEVRQVFIIYKGFNEIRENHIKNQEPKTDTCLGYNPSKYSGKVFLPLYEDNSRVIPTYYPWTKHHSCINH